MYDWIKGMVLRRKIFILANVLNMLLFLLIMSIIGTTEEGVITVDSARGLKIGLTIYVIISFIIVIVYYTKEIVAFLKRI